MQISIFLKKDIFFLKIVVIKVLVKKFFFFVDKINLFDDYFVFIYSGNDILLYCNNVLCKCDIVFQNSWIYEQDFIDILFIYLLLR